jgi:hypothetical protein
MASRKIEISLCCKKLFKSGFFLLSDISCASRKRTLRWSNEKNSFVETRKLIKHLSFWVKIDMEKKHKIDQKKRLFGQKLDSTVRQRQNMAGKAFDAV